MNKTTNDESSKFGSAKKTYLTREELDRRLENLRKDRLNDESYFVCEGSSVGISMGDYIEDLKKIDCDYETHKPTYKIKLVCDCCGKFNRSVEPITMHELTAFDLYEIFDLIKFDKSVITGLECIDGTNAEWLEERFKDKETKSLVDELRDAGAEVTLHYYCPHCCSLISSMMTYDIYGVIENNVLDDVLDHYERGDYVDVLGRDRDIIEWLYAVNQLRTKHGLFILVIKIANWEIRTIPNIFFSKTTLGRSVSIKEYQFVKLFLTKPEFKYKDFQYWLNSHHMYGLGKLKVDNILQKVLGLKIDYDDEETLKTLKVLGKRTLSSNSSLLLTLNNEIFGN